MSPGLLYLDSSALVKLILREPETGVLLELLAGWPERVSSALSRVEVLRAVRRAGLEDETFRRAEEVIGRIGLLRIDDDVLSVAARLGLPGLRTLDAMHLATALSIGEQLAALVTYDARLAEAARLSDIQVLMPYPSPGQTRHG
ncbi:MAG: type II toxin-antitoxin system VapC family toxin [Actinomycetota bacterium]|nr:type II toxin-antitoxin system VapC family toxin [Actinomycetota bacterium]MDP9485754.1 type II toxin-antitoxin system VapC family toxin [Actinomycetota bacterium]